LVFVLWLEILSQWKFYPDGNFISMELLEGTREQKKGRCSLSSDEVVKVVIVAIKRMVVDERVWRL
jgi:hypothetical protein